MIRKVKNNIHLLLAALVNLSLLFPSRGMRVVGVTGTDGKTTTSYLIYHILTQAGVRTSVITSIGAYIGRRKYDTGFHVTTPSPWRLQSYIRRAKKEGSMVLVLEVTSHALDQNRTFGVAFDLAVLTNITHEHLDYHKTYEKYTESKMKLLKKAKKTIVNMDDESYKILSSQLKAQSSELQSKTGKLVTYGMGKNADVNPHNFEFESNLVGEFNKYNILAAVAACKQLGLGDEEIRNAIATFRLPEGRQEIVYDKEFKVIVDSAHTANSLEMILSETVSTSGRLIHVFGAAGQRDKQKRPKMGAVSARYSDVIVLTAEDPRKEDVESIDDDIRKGIGKKFGETKKDDYKGEVNIYLEIPDRREAIEFAVSIAKKGDVVLLTGKGHEKSMNCGKGEEPWSDVDAVKDALKK